MTEDDISEFQTLAEVYQAKHGDEDGVIGALIGQLGFSQALKTLKKARGREIIVEHPEGIIDGIIIRYKK